MKMNFEVKDANNLIKLIREFPNARVYQKIGSPNEDCWAVKIDPTKEDGGDGPTRVVVTVENGSVAYAVPPEQAKRQWGIEPEVILVRKDGWTLGAMFRDRDPTFKLWEGDWLAEINLSTGMVTPIINANDQAFRTDPENVPEEAQDCPDCGRSLEPGQSCPTCNGHKDGADKDVDGEVFIMRAETGDGKRWMIFDSISTMKGKSKETKDQLIDRWVECHGKPRKLIRFQGIARASEYAATVASIQREIK